MSHLLTLPPELHILISSHLPVPDLSRLSRVNTYLKTLLTPTLTSKILTTRSPTYGRRLLYSAAGRNNVQLIQNLLSRGILSFVGSGALLNDAILTESDETVLGLIEAGVDVTTRYPNGEAPLLLAAERGRIRIVRELLGRVGDSEVNVNARGKRSAVMMAALGGWVEVVKLLVQDRRTKVRARDDFGRDVFWYARLGGCIDVLQRLLGTGGGCFCMKGVGNERIREGVEMGVEVKESPRPHAKDRWRKKDPSAVKFTSGM
ncbi:ankyrin [Choiromyces venosus 120613-1]|uniref:Ankyrin n=1 Tax=Choiromyces venosus 120613-1 TaxID=1336337 RepID=A0A3N4JII5_9PEZI|nr:ankyrin [Choiromyces venosus 120613-1]